MNLDKIVSGMVLKNYKELCNLIGDKPRSGGSKVAHLKLMSTFFKFHQIRNKFVIDEVYEQKIEIIDKRKDGNNNLYNKDIQALIIDLLSQSDSERLFIGVSAFITKLELVNTNYIAGRNNIPKLSEFTNIPRSNCYDYFNHTSNNLKIKLETALNSLRKRALVVWNTAITVKVSKSNINLNQFENIKLPSYIKKNNSKSKTAFIDVDTIYRKATKEESKLIIKVENLVLKNMGYSNLQEVYLSGRWREYKSYVDSMLWDYANIEYYYTSYEIIYNYDNILKAKEDVVNTNCKKTEARELDDIRDNVNKNLCKSISRYSKSRSTRAKNKILKEADKILSGMDIELKVFSNDILFANEKYVDYTHQLNNIVVKKCATSIKEELLKEFDSDQKAIQLTYNDELPF